MFIAAVVTRRKDGDDGGGSRNANHTPRRLGRMPNGEGGGTESGSQVVTDVCPNVNEELEKGGWCGAW